MPASAAFWFMIAVVTTASLSFVTIVVWLEARKKEREDQHRSDTVRRIMESGDSGPALEYLREVERTEALRARNKARVAGLITAAVGVALMIFLYQLVPGASVYLAGLIPLLIGAGLLIFSELMMKPAKS